MIEWKKNNKSSLCLFGIPIIFLIKRIDGKTGLEKQKKRKLNKRILYILTYSNL